MKIGDLVKLSAYGCKLKILESRSLDVALVITAPHSWHGSYTVKWVSDGKIEKFLSRRDLKYAKITPRS